MLYRFLQTRVYFSKMVARTSQKLVVLIAFTFVVNQVVYTDANCDSTTNQSPVDILRRSVVPVQGMNLLEPNYPPTSAILFSEEHELGLDFPETYGGNLDINGVTYKLINFHFHIPAEHTVDGYRYVMEGHAVHTTSAGDIAVVGIFYSISVGLNEFILQFENELSNLGTDSQLPISSVDPSELQLEHNEFYRYNGSLTTEPFCSGVTWNVLKKAQSVSFQQFQLMKNALNGTNARPVQDLDGRTILYFKGNSTLDHTPLQTSVGAAMGGQHDS